MPTPYQPPAEQYQPPSPSPMDQLIEMGFGDRARNQQLLEKHNDDVSRSVQELIQEEDNEWHNNRHWDWDISSNMTLFQDKEAK